LNTIHSLEMAENIANCFVIGFYSLPSPTSVVDCTDSRTLFVRNPEHLYETPNSRAFAHGNLPETMLKPDNWRDGNDNLLLGWNLVLALAQN